MELTSEGTVGQTDLPAPWIEVELPKPEPITLGDRFRAIAVLELLPVLVVSIDGVWEVPR